MTTFKDEKISVVRHEKVSQAVASLAEVLRGEEKIPREATFQEIVISHPGNADASLHYRTAQE